MCQQWGFSLISAAPKPQGWLGVERGLLGVPSPGYALCKLETLEFGFEWRLGLMGVGFGWGSGSDGVRFRVKGVHISWSSDFGLSKRLRGDPWGLGRVGVQI